MTSKAFPTRQIARLTGANGPINAVTYSAGVGQYILTASSDRTIRLYNPTPPSTSTLLPYTPPPIQSYSAHGHPVLSLSISSDNSRFASAGGDRSVFLWDVATATTLRRFSGHSGRVNCVAFGGESVTPGGESLLVSGGFDCSVKVWDLRQGGGAGGKPIMSMNEARDGVSALVVWGKEIIAGSVDGGLRTYDVRMGVVVTDVMPAPVTSLSLTKVGDSVLVGTLDSTVRLFDRSGGRLLKSYKDEGFVSKEYRVQSVMAQADARVLAGSETGEVLVWDVLEGTVKERLKHSKDAGLSKSRQIVSAVAWNQKRNEWCSAGGDGTVTVWGAP